jgi:Tol biopolymer transport system component
MIFNQGHSTVASIGDALKSHLYFWSIRVRKNTVSFNSSLTSQRRTGMSNQVFNFKTAASILGVIYLCIAGSKESFGASQAPQAQYKIAYNSIVNGHMLICTVNADGVGQTQLTSDTADFFYPEWSPDGKKIVFVKSKSEGSGILTMNADGTAKTALPDSASDDYDERALWSPDGNKIVFVKNEMGGGIYIMNQDGSNPRRLTNGYSPVWSKDGKKIVFVSGPGFGAPDQICTMNADGSGKQQLTNDASDTREPKWSPDGARIAFVS